MAWYEIWKDKKTIIDRLNDHLKDRPFEEKVACLKAIVSEVCPGAHVSYNPKGGKRKPKANTEGKEQV